MARRGGFCVLTCCRVGWGGGLGVEDLVEGGGEDGGFFGGDFAAFDVFDVEGVDDLVADGVDFGDVGVDAVLPEGVGDGVEEADLVGGHDFEDGEGVGEVLVDGDGGVYGGGGAWWEAVFAYFSFEELFDVELAVEDEAEVFF